MAKKIVYNPFTNNFDLVLGIENPLQFKGSISVASDFPTSSEVENGWFYKITADVTDNDPTKTNTGQSFESGDEIAWDGSSWVNIGFSEFIDKGTTNGQLIYWDGNKWTYIDTSYVFWDNTNNRLGIGTDNPEYPLDVDGRIRSTFAGGSFEATCINPSIDFVHTTGGMRRRINMGSTGRMNFYYDADNDDAGWINQAVIDADGKVGIGTDSPSAKLDVSGGEIKEDNREVLRYNLLLS